MNSHTQDSLKIKQIEKIATNAQSLLTRIYHSNDLCNEEYLENIEDLIQKWREVLSKRDKNFFERRLHWAGLNEDKIKRKLSGKPLAADFLSDDLKLLLANIPEDLNNYEQKYKHYYELSNKQVITFPMFWFPFLLLARKKLEAQISIKDIFEPLAINTIERQLLSELSRLAELALFDEFSRYRNQSYKHSALFLSSEDSVLKQFCMDLLQQGLLELFEKYPVLARHIFQLINTWVAMYASLCKRLSQDREEIIQLFNGGKKVGKVQQIQLNLSDRHQGGQQIVVLEFEQFKLVYKPRTVIQESLFNGFLNWLNEFQDIPDLPTYKVLDKTTYGWVEYINASACQTRQEVEDYYAKAGVLLGIAYLLNDNDCHMENLVATINGPVLIDVETLLQPSVLDQSRLQGALYKAKQKIQNSVLKSGLIQFLQKGKNGQWVDASGLRGTGEQLQPNQERLWKHVNTDAMLLGYRNSRPPPQKNLVYLQDQLQNISTYIDYFVSGFSDFYTFVLKNKTLLISDKSPLNAFKQSSVRLVFRPSNDYALLLHALNRPKYQTGGLARSLKIETLSTVFAQQTDKPQLWPLLKDEMMAIEDLDIPVFRIQADSHDVKSAHGFVKDLLHKSCCQQLFERIEDWSEGDLKEQINLIRSLLIETSQQYHIQTLIYENIENHGNEAEDLAQAVLDIADDICQQTIQGNDDSITWLASSYIQTENQRAAGDSYYLYSGSCGIMLFLAAASYYCNNQNYADTVRRACLPIKKVLNSPIREQLLEQEPIGIANGLGSFIYSFICIAHWLNDEEYLDLAEQFAALISESKITTDKRYDLEGGSAGAILALLTLFQVTDNSQYLRQAQSCAEYLEKNAVVTDSGYNWPNDEGLGLAGYAHGVAGIAMALMKLYSVDTNERWYKLALQAIDYENSIYLKEHQNWPVLIRDDSRVDNRIIMNTWCHGAPGIALARSLMLEVCDNPGLKNDFNLAQNTLLNTGIGPIDHLCCGNLGRADIMLTLGLRHNNKEVEQKAKSIVGAVIQRYKKQGYWRLFLKNEDNFCFEPGFFRGSSGIGYTLLRMIAPQDFPSVLQFQVPKDYSHKEDIK